MTSSPYKSKVLNFVVAKYRQILTQRDRAFRHLKLTATNTAQLLLYPIYVLLQTSRIALKQLQQTTKNELPQTKEKVNKNNQTTDKPIQEVSVIPTQVNPKLYDPPNPQLMVKMPGQVFSELEIVDNYKASEISTKVKQDNPPILEIGKTKEKPLLLLQPCAELVPSFGLLGGVWQIMAWVQTSKIALWFNLFDESNIVLEQNEQKDNNRGLAAHQSQPLLSSSNLTFGGFIYDLAKHYLYPITRGLGLNGLLPPFKTEEEWEFESFKEPELDQENQQSSLVTQDETPIVASLISSFEPETFQIATSLTTKPLINPGSIEKLGKEKNLPLHEHPYYGKTSTSNNSPKKEAIIFQEVLRKIDGHRTEQDMDISINSTKVSVQTYKLESRPKDQPNYLEVESVPVGYVKHPLEIILGLVDVIMTWVEKIFVQMWQWCQQKLKIF